MRVYKACCLSVLLFGCETWAYRRVELKAAESFHMTSLRWILGITRQQQHDTHTSNEKMRRKAGITSIESMVNARILSWLGHVARMDNVRAPKKLLFAWEETGQRFKGNSPFGRYRDVIKRIFEEREIDHYVWLQIAHDRKGWRKFVKAYTEVQEESEEDEEEEEESDEEVEEAEGVANKRILCPFAGCGHTCKNRIGLRRHITCKHRTGTQGEEGFKCGIGDCTYVGVTRQVVEKHRSMNHKPGAVKCEHCGVYVPSNATLNKHIFTKHPEIPRGPGRGRHSETARANRALGIAPRAQPKPKAKAKAKPKAKR